METMFDEQRAGEIQMRLTHLEPESPRQWGTMAPAQMLAHCAIGVKMAMGEICPPRSLIGRILGGLVKKMALKTGEPMRRNSPTVKELVVGDDRNFVAEKARLQQAIDEFVAAGPNGCTNHPHMFFGALTPQEWGVLMYKHLDHHLRQFGV